VQQRPASSGQPRPASSGQPRPASSGQPRPAQQQLTSARLTALPEAQDAEQTIDAEYVVVEPGDPAYQRIAPWVQDVRAQVGDTEDA